MKVLVCTTLDSYRKFISTTSGIEIVSVFTYKDEIIVTYKGVLLK